MGKSSGGGTQTGFSALPGQLQSQGFDIADLSMDDFQAGPQQFFPGQTYADFDPLQLQGFNSQLDFANNQLPGQLGAINTSFGNALNAGNIFSDPSVQAGLGTIENRAIDTLINRALPAIDLNATGAGALGGSRQGVAQGTAIGDTAQAIGDAQASFLADQLGSARQLQASSLGLAPQTTQLGLLPGQIQGQVGGAFQGMDQNAINEAMSRFNFGQNADDLNLDALVNRFSNISGFGGASSLSNPGGGVNPVSQALGGAMLGNQLLAGGTAAFGAMPTFAGLGAGGTTALYSGLGAILPFLSDERMKDHINQVGTLDNGLPVYTFRYKGDDTTQMGVMAQDVEKIMPDAVTEIDGIKHVYYDRIT